MLGSYPHDPRAFTEGLAIAGHRLIESDGLYGHSQLTISPLRGGSPIARRALPDNVFGEGVAAVGDRIVQLSWRERVGFVYDFSLSPVARFAFHDEGWGLTYDGRRLIYSDGSDRLHFLDSRTWQPIGRPLTVHDGEAPVFQLNELEYAAGLIYANIWHDSRIAVIRPTDGSVVGWIDLSPLLRQLSFAADVDVSEAVANGIAFDPASGHFFVTGKNWPRLFEIALDRTVAPAVGAPPPAYAAGRAAPQ